MTAVNVIKSHLAEDSNTSILTHEVGGLMGDVLLAQAQVPFSCHQALPDMPFNWGYTTPESGHSISYPQRYGWRESSVTICYIPAIHHKIMISGNPDWGWEALQLYFLKIELDCLTVWFLSWPMQGWIVQLVARLWNWWHLLLGYSDESKASTMQPPLNSCEDTFNQARVVWSGGLVFLTSNSSPSNVRPSETLSQEWLTWWFWIKEPPKSTS
ncbi:hypothetical protein IW261DRAFT_1421842 [Armillaria novae-zelandiae]|uniref:Uncharacterized protein n=1 Tax=Armillaria novae-zelandiae TaxID=153914 RepID=A0AA39P2B8_9AGAR|nr:hypothetical protein IW261DRAFT_1421842 [Armillaria novae-zelandiae]